MNENGKIIMMSHLRLLMNYYVNQLKAKLGTKSLKKKEYYKKRDIGINLAFMLQKPNLWKISVSASFMKKGDKKKRQRIRNRNCPS